jgi:hypothetical protein
MCGLSSAVLDLAEVDADFVARCFFALSSGCTAVACLGFLPRLAFYPLYYLLRVLAHAPSEPEKHSATQFSNFPPN